MSVQRKRYSADEKTRVAIEAIKGQKTLNELAAEYGMWYLFGRYVDYERLHVAEISRDGGSIPHHYETGFGTRQQAEARGSSKLLSSVANNGRF